MLDFRSYPDFTTASQDVLKLLSDRVRFNLWMVTRVSGDDWIVLQAEDRGYQVKSGDIFSWADSFCCEMVQGRGPCIAPDALQVLTYRNAAINQRVQIAAYVGLPLCDRHGNLFGTLCGIHPTPFPSELEAELPLFQVLAKLLGSLLDAELQSQQESRRAERAEAEAQTDALTGLYNRRGWDKLLALEEKRCQQLGLAACVIVVDLDNLKQINDRYGHAMGDRYLRRLAEVIQQVLRRQDIAARIGGDEFAILGLEMDAQGMMALIERLRLQLTAEHIDASLGGALRQHSRGLIAAWQEADVAMYNQKTTKKGNIPSVVSAASTSESTVMDTDGHGRQ